MSNKLHTTLLGVPMQNPVIAASGTFGFGDAYAPYLDVSRLGGISGKGLTLHGSPGNHGARVWETPAGLLNSIGLENPGVTAFVQTHCHTMRQTGAAVLCNLGGHTVEEYVEGAHLLNDADMDILELNISCPNVREGGMAFGTDPLVARRVVERVKRVTRFPLLVKLSPNAPDLGAVADACCDGGADGLCLCNTLLGMAIDVKAKKAVFDNTYAGLSGPCIRPIALRMVHQIAHRAPVPVVGCGGIATADDALMFLMAGAAAVEVGSATFRDPGSMIRIIEGLEAYCQENGLEHISRICGIV